MAKQKSDAKGAVPEHEELVKRVDAMMDPKAGASVASSISAPVEAKAEVPSTAPELPGAPKITKLTKPAKKTKKIKPIEPEKPNTEAVPVAVKKTTPELPLDPSIDLDDTTTEDAVDDIVVKEADTVLAVEDAQRGRKQREAETESRQGTGGFWSALGTAILILLIAGIIASIVVLVAYGT